jgi:hypothetical protein
MVTPFQMALGMGTLLLNGNHLALGGGICQAPA